MTKRRVTNVVLEVNRDDSTIIVRADGYTLKKLAHSGEDELSMFSALDRAAYYFYGYVDGLTRGEATEKVSPVDDGDRPIAHGPDVMPGVQPEDFDDIADDAFSKRPDQGYDRTLTPADPRRTPRK